MGAQRQEQTAVTNQVVRQEETPPLSRKGRPSSSVQAVNWLDETHPHWGGPPALFSPQIQVFTS